MKIALVNLSDLGGGAERSVVSLHLGLLASGQESRLYVGKKRSSIPNVIELPYVRGMPGSRRLARVIERKTGWQDIYNPSFRALQAIIEPDTQIIHFHNIWSASNDSFGDIGILPALTRKIPGVFTEHQTWSFTGHCGYFRECMRWKTGCGQCPDLSIPPAIQADGTQFNWRRKKRKISNSDLTFVGVSNWVTELANQSPIWAGKRKETIYDSIDTRIFHPVSLEEKQQLRVSLGVPLDRKVILITGQTLEGFVDGFAPQGLSAAVGLDDSKVVLLLVGRSSLLAAQQLRFPTIALPFQKEPEDMAKCYHVADLNLSASRVEAFGCIPAEAQACGIPVVAFATGGLAEVVRDGVGGFSILAGDTAGLLQAMKRLLADDALCHRLGADGRQFVMDNFSVKKIVNKHLELYGEICSA